MLEKTQELLKSTFKQYYFKRNEKFEVPTRINEREIGYIPFGGGMIRHLSVKTAGELMAILVKEAPYGVYASSSYYEDPSLPMAEKVWKGGDLVFDIDADDLNLQCKEEHDWWLCKNCGSFQVGLRPQKCTVCSNTKILTINWACEKCLGASKNEAINLQEILQRDFGASKNEITVYFSGNKGYHISVDRKSWHGMDQRARGEITEYVSGKGIRAETFGLSHNASYEDFLPWIPTLGDSGWRGRFAEFIKGYGDDRMTEPRLKAATIFGKMKPEEFQNLIMEMVRKYGSRVDPSVTTDIHRIFRLPGSIHGDSGLSKKRCNDIFSFNPSTDPVEIGEEETTVQVKFCSKFSLMERTFGPYINQKVTLPLYAATYIMAKNLAEVSQ